MEQESASSILEVRYNQMKMIGLLILALLFTVGIYLWQTEIGDDEMFILPEGYRGVVFILYDQKNGEPAKYEQGKRVYEIPPNGVLKTQFSLNTGWHRFGEYYYKENGKLVKIPYVIDGKDTESNRSIEPDKVHVCCSSSGKAGKDPNDAPIIFGQFYVGTKEDISNASEKREKINPADLVN
jgi:hypothetical protein